jgi:hypothetical protein
LRPGVLANPKSDKTFGKNLPRHRFPPTATQPTPFSFPDRHPAKILVTLSEPYLSRSSKGRTLQDSRSVERGRFLGHGNRRRSGLDRISPKKAPARVPQKWKAGNSDIQKSPRVSDAAA